MLFEKHFSLARSNIEEFKGCNLSECFPIKWPTMQKTAEELFPKLSRRITMPF